MKVTGELFVIPKKNNFILYAPLQGSVLEVTPATVGLLKKIKAGEYDGNHKEVIDELKAKKILLEDDACDAKAPEEPKFEGFQPTSVTLFPTSDCNLACIYCYASAGETHQLMSPELAKASIDFVVENALKTRSKKIGVGFHGGGEPFCNFDIIKFATEYAQEKAKANNLKLNTNTGTNCVLSKPQLEWIVKNIDRVTVSLDGPEDIQNLQRPLKNGMPSFDKVMETIRYFEEKKQNYGIRSTITQYNVDRMSEMVELFAKICSKKEFHFEPVFECGRCKKTQTYEPNPERFLKRFIEAKQVAEKLGTDIYYSGGKLDSVSVVFCGAAGTNFYVTQEGFVTSCLEVTKQEDPRSQVFFYGQFKDGKCQVEQDKIKYLMSRNVNNLPHCKDCFAKFGCAGDCLAKVMSKGDMFDPSDNTRCSINHGASLYEMDKKLKGCQNVQTKLQN